MRSPEDRSWKAKSSPQGEPSKEMVDEGVRTLKVKGHLWVPAGVPRRWLEHSVKEVWKAMQRVAGGRQ